MHGNVQNFIDRNFITPRLSQSQVDWASGFLNINHGENMQNMPPMPDLFSKSTFMDRSTSTFQILVPAAYTGFDLVLAPFYNIVALIRFNSSTTGMQDHWYALEDTTKVTSDGDGGAICSASYAKRMKMYGNRIIARALTMVNQTNQFNIGGDIKMVKLENSVDISDIPESYAPQYPSSGKMFSVLQRLPSSDTDMSNVVGGYVQQTAKDGAYCIAKVSDLSWKNRQHVWDKVNPWYDDNVLAVGVDGMYSDNVLGTSDSKGNEYNVYFPDANTEYGTFNGVIHPDCAHVYPAVVDPRIMGLDTTFIRVTGLNTGADNNGSTFSLRINSIAESALHADSPYIKQKTRRPVPDVADEAFVKSALLYQSLQTAMYPSYFNFWDKVWSGFKKAWNWLAPVRKVLPGMLGPGGAGIAGTADNLISQLVTHN